MKIPFKFVKGTKTCYRFEHREGVEMETLYLKKTSVDKAGLDPRNGIIITIEEDHENA